jgi:hypothetical protein
VKVDEGPFWYTPNSAKLTEGLISWHEDRVRDMKSGMVEEWRGQPHKEGSFRASLEELADLGYKPFPVEVDADTLVVANVFGFHRRGDTVKPTNRVSMHGSIRLKNPFAWS